MKIEWPYRAKTGLKALAGGQSPLQELEVGPCSGPYPLVYPTESDQVAICLLDLLATAVSTKTAMSVELVELAYSN